MLAIDLRRRSTCIVADDWRRAPGRTIHEAAAASEPFGAPPVEMLVAYGRIDLDGPDAVATTERPVRPRAASRRIRGGHQPVQVTSGWWLASMAASVPMAAW